MSRQPYPARVQAGSRQRSENSGLRNLLEADFDVAPLIERIDQFDITRGDQLVFDEHCRRYRFLLQNAHRERNQFITVPFWKIGHRADQSRTWFAQFHAGVADGVLAHDRAKMAESCLLESP